MELRHKGVLYDFEYDSAPNDETNANGPDGINGLIHASITVNSKWRPVTTDVLMEGAAAIEEFSTDVEGWAPLYEKTGLPAPSRLLGGLEEVSRPTCGSTPSALFLVRRCRMNEFLGKLLSSDFMGHGYCYLWKPEIVWLNAISDGLIALSYYLIPVMLIYLVRKRRDLPFHWMFLMFGLFILSCGTTHAMEIWTLWHGTYRLASLIKAITAGASLATAMALVPMLPRVFQLPSPAQLRSANLELEKEIDERRRAEEALRSARADLELRVQQRTAELAKANQELRIEITHRRLVEETLRKQASLLDLAHDAIIVRDMDDAVTYWNAGAEEMYGWKCEEVAGRTTLELLHSMPASRLADLKAEVIREGRWEGELIHTRRDGSKLSSPAGGRCSEMRKAGRSLCSRLIATSPT